jgi:glycosyltransferase involved in cell wall biosynthesis
VRVGLSLLTLVPGEIGGSETYARGLTGGLARSGALDVTALVPRIAPDAGGGLPTEVVPEYRASASMAGRLRAMTLARLAPGAVRSRFAGLELVHYPLTVPVPSVEASVVITLHDVQHLDLPHLFPRAERAFRRLAYDRVARDADAVIVPTTFVRERAIARLGLDPGRVHVTPHGIDHSVFSPVDAAREPFLLYPAKAWPHKNHATLLQAFALLRVDRPELRLVLTGAGTEHLEGPTGVDARGVVPLPELVSLYRRTSCVVFPSLYEGFGAPPLEAMACGAPVAASTAGSLPEVCGDAAVLFDPHDPSAVARGVAGALERGAELTALGIAHAASFTWDACARLHEGVYRATEQ